MEDKHIAPSAVPTFPSAFAPQLDCVILIISQARVRPETEIHLDAKSIKATAAILDDEVVALDSEGCRALRAARSQSLIAP